MSNLDTTGYAAYLDAHDKTTRTPLQSLAAFGKFLDARQWDAAQGLTVSGIMAYAAWLKEHELSPRSRATYLACLAGFYRYLVRSGTITPSAQELEQVRAELGDLLADLNRKIRREPLHKRLPSGETVAAVLGASAVPENAEGVPLEALRDHAILLALASTGARVSELARLRRRDLDPATRSARVLGKGGKTRTVYFSPEAWQAYEAYTLAWLGAEKPENADSLPAFAAQKRGKPSGPISVRTIQRVVEHAAKAAGIQRDFHLTPHGFRHYVATRFLASSGNLAAAQDLLGHASPNTTRIYAAVDEAHLRQLHQAAFAAQGE